jgi:hypothetical protein
MTSSIPILSDPIVVLSTSLALATLLIGAAVRKLRHADAFIAALESYRILPDVMLPIARWAIPVVEAGVAVGLILPSSRQIAAALAAVLLIAYGAAMARTLVQGRRIADCGCSLGSSRQRADAAMVCRNGVLAALAANLIQPMAERDLGLGDWVVVVLAFATGSAVYALANSLIANHYLIRELSHE